MNEFFIKYSDGKTDTADAEIASGNITSLKFPPKYEFDKIEYVELKLHSDAIHAGDKGYYLVQAGNARCESRDFGIGFYKERKDGEFIIRDCFMPVFGIAHNDKCYIAIVTGMATDISQVIRIEHNQYFINVRFDIDGTTPYEDIKVEFHKIDKSDAEYSDMAKE